MSTWVLGVGGSWRLSITKKGEGGMWGRGEGDGMGKWLWVTPRA